jgi:hypothetical protein
MMTATVDKWPMTYDRTLADMLSDAIAAKARELGHDYSYRDLEHDSDVSYSYVSKVLRRGQRPSREIIAAWSSALRPYLPLSDALLAAGYLPNDDDPRSSIARRLWHLTPDALALLSAAIRDELAKGKPRTDADARQLRAALDELEQRGNPERRDDEERSE